MNKKKSLIEVIVLSLLLIAFSGINVFAANGVKLAAEKTGENVKLTIKSIDSIVNAFQLSLKIDGDVKLNNIEWNNEIKTNARTNYKYNKETNIVEIYITSHQNLVDEGGNIEIGTLVLDAEDLTKFSIIPDSSNTGNAYKFVSNTYKESESANIATDGVLDFIYSKAPVIDEVPDQDGTEEKPEGGDTTDKVEEEKSEDIDSTVKVENKENDVAANGESTAVSLATGAKKVMPIIALTVITFATVVCISRNKLKKR